MQSKIKKLNCTTKKLHQNEKKKSSAGHLECKSEKNSDFF